MQETPKGLRLHIGIFGRRNVGKSSLINALIGQPIAIVSDQPGTTTDPVEKTYELAPMGPVVFIDTAGVDDVGALGELRKERTYAVLERTDVALLVTDGKFGEFEEKLAAEFRAKAIPFLVVFNKSDVTKPSAEVMAKLSETQLRALSASATTGENIAAIKPALAEIAPEGKMLEPQLLGDLTRPGDVVMLVVPIDLGAPKGRLILPQVMAIRDLLDSDAIAMVVKERELKSALQSLAQKPKLVVCDSQVVLKVAADTPEDVPLTTFSILMARLKGDLIKLAEGAAAIRKLKSGDRVLVAEACAHHALADDIGRVKIPRWIKQYAGGKIECDVAAGADFPKDLSEYKLVVQCGGCMINRRQMMSRIEKAESTGVPITNYGVTISLIQGVLPRVLRPFPAALEAYERVICQEMKAK